MQCSSKYTFFFNTDNPRQLNFVYLQFFRKFTLHEVPSCKIRDVHVFSNTLYFQVLKFFIYFLKISTFYYQILNFSPYLYFWIFHFSNYLFFLLGISNSGIIQILNFSRFCLYSEFSIFPLELLKKSELFQMESWIWNFSVLELFNLWSNDSLIFKKTYLKAFAKCLIHKIKNWGKINTWYIPYLLMQTMHWKIREHWVLMRVQHWKILCF